MKKTLLILCLLLLAFPVFAQDSRETLVLKRDLAQERVMRIQAELGLLKAQFREGQEALKLSSKELDELNVKLRAEETKVAPIKK